MSCKYREKPGKPGGPHWYYPPYVLALPLLSVYPSWCMSDTPPNDDLRLVRILAQGALLREVDGLVRHGLGGYQTRQEFFLDAIENQILEVKYSGTEHGERRLLVDQLALSELAEPQGATENGPSNAADDAGDPTADAPEPPALANGGPIRRLADLAETELVSPSPGPAMLSGQALAPDEPLFGLHNRDYPSLWSAQQLALQTQGGFIPLKDYIETTLTEAWRFAESLEELNRQAQTKLTALFPKNWAKPQSAEESFKAFAIGALAKKPLPDGKVNASGPLYTWGLAQVQRNEEGLEVGLTGPGYELLAQLAGISLRLPHEEHFAERFLNFLKEHAPADAAGFDYLLEAVPEGPTRVELAGRFQEWQPAWSDTEANTYAAAYVARAREWGLLEHKLIDRCYVLTEFGQRRRAGVAA